MTSYSECPCMRGIGEDTAANEPETNNTKRDCVRGLQTLSRKSLGRDDPSEEDDKKQWKRWLDDLLKQQEMQVVRCFKPKGFGEIKEVQLHLFTEASRQWYSAVVYLRLKDVTNQIHCAFVIGKARCGLIHKISN